MADAIEIFTNSASERIEVITSGAQGPQGPAGPAGATFDQDLNTTDGVTFASVAVGTDLRINGALNEIYFPADGSGGVIGFEEQIIRSGSTYVMGWSGSATYHYVPLEFPSPATAATTRTNLGLGTAATANVGDFAQINGSPTFASIYFNEGSAIYGTAGGLVIKSHDDAPGSNAPILLTSTSGCLLNAGAPIGWQTSTFQLFNTGSLLQFVGKTSSFPALKRVSSALQVRLADDSAFADFYAAAGTFTSLAATGLSLAAGSLSASAPFDLSQTWNNSGVTFTGIKFNVTDTNSAAASLFADFQVGGIGQLRVDKQGRLSWPNPNQTAAFNALTVGSGSAGFIIRSAQGSAWNIGNIAFYRPDLTPMAYITDVLLGVAGYLAIGSSNLSTNVDTLLYRDASGTLAQRNGTNAQEFRLYNTYTSSTNYERGFFKWDSNVLKIGTEKGSGGGTARALQFQTDGAPRFTLSTGGGLFIGDGSTQANNFFGWSGNGGFRAQQTSTGVITLLNWAETDFNRLQFGGTTSTFPALKRSSTALQVRLADDSAYSVLDAQLRAQGTAPATSGANGTAGDIRYDADYIYVCTAANTWKRVAIATW